MLTDGFISLDTILIQEVFRVGALAPTTDSAPPEDVQRAKETLRAIEILGDERTQVELEELIHERYELLP